MYGSPSQYSLSGFLPYRGFGLGARSKFAPNPQPSHNSVPTATTTTLQGQAPPIPANAPHMSKQTRYEIIRDFETQLGVLAYRLSHGQ